MFTNNYWLMKAYAEGHAAPSNYATLEIGLKDKNGEDANIYVIGGNATYPAYSAPWNTALCSRLIVGTGNNPASVSDVDLQTDVTSSLSSVEQTATTGADNNSLKTVYTISATNDTGAEITIKEVGIETTVYNSSNQTFKILTARQLLQNPITVAAGAGFVLTVSADTK